MSNDWVVSALTPAPQTLMVWSYEPDTILVPSLLKPTDAMDLLWAFSLLVMSSRVSVQSRGVVTDWVVTGWCQA